MKRLLGVLLISLSGIALANNLEDGIQAYLDKNYTMAVKILVPLAEQGDTDAMVYVAQMHRFGRGVPESAEMAFGWAERCANSGDAVCENLLGLFYDNGFGVAENAAKAVTLYRSAANKGSYVAAYNLGLSYEEGDGVNQSNAEALRWYKISAESGYESAKEKVAELTAQLAANNADFKVAATDIINEFKANKLAANLKYKDKTVLIEGVADEIAPTRFEIPESVQIDLKDSSHTYSFEDVNVILEPTSEQLSLATKLTKGDYVRVLCRNVQSGLIMGVRAKNCFLVPGSTGGQIDLIDATTVVLEFGSPSRNSVESRYTGKRVRAKMFITAFEERSGSRRMKDGNSPFFCDVFPSDLPNFPTKRGGYVVEGTFVVDAGVPGLTRCKYVPDQ